MHNLRAYIEWLGDHLHIYPPHLHLVSDEIKSIKTAVFHQVGRCLHAWDQNWNLILNTVLGEEYHLSLI